MSASEQNACVAELDQLLGDDLRGEMLVAEIRIRMERRRYQKDLLIQRYSTQGDETLPNLVRSPSESRTASASRIGTAFVSGLDQATRGQIAQGEASVRYIVKGKFASVDGWQKQVINI